MSSLVVLPVRTVRHATDFRSGTSSSGFGDVFDTSDFQCFPPPPSAPGTNQDVYLHDWGYRVPTTQEFISMIEDEIGIKDRNFG